jgi:hypothetical protein
MVASAAKKVVAAKASKKVVPAEAPIEAATTMVAPAPAQVPDLTAVLWPLTTINRPEPGRRPEPRRRGIDVSAVITRALTAAGLMK